MNLYILAREVVELYASRGAQSWWGAPLGWIRRSIINYVIPNRLFVLMGNYSRLDTAEALE
jgi:hypothetical protein